MLNALGGEDGCVKMWSRNGMLRSQLVQLGRPVYAVEWNSDSTKLVYSYGEHCSIKLLKAQVKMRRINFYTTLFIFSLIHHQVPFRLNQLNGTLTTVLFSVWVGHQQMTQLSAEAKVLNLFGQLNNSKHHFRLSLSTLGRVWAPSVELKFTWSSRDVCGVEPFWRNVRCWSIQIVKTLWSSWGKFFRVTTNLQIRF